MKSIIDVAIIGSGPGGMTAAIYAARAGLKTAIFEKATIGGQMSYTNEIENFPGIDKTSGYDLATILDGQAKKFNTEYINEEVTSIKKDGCLFKITTSSKEYSSYTVILALGAKPRNLGIESEFRLRGSGVSYCATCDGNFYRGADVAVIGGGNTAFEDALFLSNICRRVYIVHRRSEFRAEKILQEQVKKAGNIELVVNSQTKDILGKFEVNGIVVTNKEGVDRNIEVQGVFVAIGTIPNSNLVKDLVKLDEYGYIVTDKNMETSVPGIFAVGDVRDTVLRQIVTACSDGAIAAQAAGRIISENRWEIYGVYY